MTFYSFENGGTSIGYGVSKEKIRVCNQKENSHTAYIVCGEYQGLPWLHKVNPRCCIMRGY